MRFDTNKIVISGTIDRIEAVKTKLGIPAINLFVLIEGKYQDIVSCQAYGDLANLIEKQYLIGTNVIVVGRLRSVIAKESGKSSNWIVIEKIGEELFVVENDGGTQDGFRS